MKKIHCKNESSKTQKKMNKNILEMKQKYNYIRNYIILKLKKVIAKFNRRSNYIQKKKTLVVRLK